MNTTRKLHPHGDHHRYTYNRCRCDACRAAHAETHRQRRRAIAYGRWQGLIDATGTIRRLRALARIGYAFTYIGGRRGIDASSVREFARGEHPRIQAATARAYALLYDELCTTDGPSKRAASEARRKGWHGPEAWTDDTIYDPAAQPCRSDPVDEVLVQRAIDGDADAATVLNSAERAEATRRLVRRGHGASTVARRLRVSGATAKRLLQATGEVAA
jgi:hypothetical protein